LRPAFWCRFQGHNFGLGIEGLIWLVPAQPPQMLVKFYTKCNTIHNEFITRRLVPAKNGIRGARLPAFVCFSRRYLKNLGSLNSTYIMFHHESGKPHLFLGKTSKVRKLPALVFALLRVLASYSFVLQHKRECRLIDCGK